MNRSAPAREDVLLVAPDLREPRAVGRGVVPAAELLPYGAERERLRLLHLREAAGQVARVLQAPQLRDGLKQCGKQALLRVARPDGPRRNPVDAPVKEIKPDAGALEKPP